MNDTKGQIRTELCRALEGLGAPPYLLAAVASWGDGLSDAEVLQLLKSWNDGTFRIAVITDTGEVPRPKLRLVT